MARKIIRLTTTKVGLEAALAKEAPASLRQWLELSTEELEYKLRYAKTEETQVLQGALRVLDDISSIIE